MVVKIKPLFIPLKTEHFDAWKSGDKTDELRLYGKRWNERTCWVGRDVVLSRGYGRKHRMRGRLWKFKKQHAPTFGSAYKAAILDCFKTLDVWIAVISIDHLEVIDGSKKKAGC